MLCVLPVGDVGLKVMNSWAPLQKQEFYFGLVYFIFFYHLVCLSLYMHDSETSVFSPNVSLALSICHCDRRSRIVHEGMNLNDDLFFLMSVLSY